MGFSPDFIVFDSGPNYGAGKAKAITERQSRSVVVAQTPVDIPSPGTLAASFILAATDRYELRSRALRTAQLRCGEIACRAPPPNLHLTILQLRELLPFRSKL